MLGKKWKTILRFLRIGCMMMAAGALCACGSGGALSEEDMLRTLLESPAYRARANITFYSNKGENVYEVMQYAEASGRFRIEILEPDTYRGVSTVCDGTKVVQKDPDIGAAAEAKPSPVRELLLLYGFAGCCAADAEHDMQIQENADGGRQAVLTAHADKGVVSKLRLIADAKTAVPSLMELMNEQEQVVVRIEFTSFEWVEDLDDSLFTTE